MSVNYGTEFLNKIKYKKLNHVDHRPEEEYVRAGATRLPMLYLFWLEKIKTCSNTVHNNVISLENIPMKNSVLPRCQWNRIEF